MELIATHQCKRGECNDMITAVSCVNLRKDDGEVRDAEENIVMHCTLCGKKKLLGKTTSSVVRITFKNSEELFCDKCADVFTEVCVYGNAVFVNAHDWELSSRVTRVSAIQEEMMCFRCAKRGASHLFVKYIDIVRYEKVGRYRPSHYVKMCGRCVVGILDWMRYVKLVNEPENKFPVRKSKSREKLPFVPVRRWVQ
jgi:hypothetical protein